MKILHIIASMDPSTGGPCQGIRNSSLMLRKLGISRDVLCFDNDNASYLGTDTFPVYALGPGLSVWKYNSKLISWLRNNVHKYDVIVSNGLWIYHTIAVRKVLVELKNRTFQNSDNTYSIPRWFIMPHGMLDPYFQKAPNRKFKAIRNWIYWKLFERKVIEQADGLLFTCKEELLLAKKTFTPYCPKKEINVGYGIDRPPAFTCDMRLSFLEKCPNVNDKPYFLFLSRIHSKKGIDLLVNAYINIINNLPNTKFLPDLVIAGPGLESEFGRNIYSIVAKTHQVSSKIHFPGMLTGNSKWGAFYCCEAFILPSHQENFGIAIVEALACGKPVLITNKVNIWSDICSLGGGIVAENTLHGTMSLLQSWLNMSTVQRNVMCNEASNTFKEKFFIENVVQRFVSAIS